jgi:hypothetical protein
LKVVPLQKGIKNPDSSPVTKSWERNDRDCDAKVQKTWNIANHFNPHYYAPALCSHPQEAGGFFFQSVSA